MMLQPMSAYLRSCKMNNVTFIDFIQTDGLTQTFAVIDKGNNEFTTMLKTTYDAQQAQVSTPLASQENN